MNYQHFLKALGSAAVFTFAGSALADSVSPASYENTLAVGESVTISKTVTVDAGGPTSAKVDVWFVSDTTGSMGGIINSVRSSASTILSSLSGFGDVSFGVGEYKDTFDTFTYRTNTALTNDAAAVQTGINQWSATGGNDTPEANLIALQEVATNGGWREGSSRFIVQFGDAVGHIGRDDAAPVPFPASSEVNALAAMNDAGVTLLVAGTNGMNSAGGGAAANQSIRLSEATGGSFSLISSNPGNAIANIIKDAIDAAFSEYSMVSLVPVGNLPGVGVEVSAPIVGEFDRSITRTFDFDVTFTGLAPGVHDFTIEARVDGGTVAVETDRITVPGGDGVTPVPVPAALPMLVAAFGVLGFMRRRRG